MVPAGMREQLQERCIGSVIRRTQFIFTHDHQTSVPWRVESSNVVRSPLGRNPLKI